MQILQGTVRHLMTISGWGSFLTIRMTLAVNRQVTGSAQCVT